MDWQATLRKIEDDKLRNVLSRAIKATWCPERNGWRVAMPMVIEGPWQDLVSLLECRPAKAEMRRASIHSLGTLCDSKFYEFSLSGGRA